MCKPPEDILLKRALKSFRMKYSQKKVLILDFFSFVIVIVLKFKTRRVLFFQKSARLPEREVTLKTIWFTKVEIL